MRLFEGLDATDYQDLLRALGRKLDDAGSRDLRLLETDSGLLVQTRQTGDRRAGFATVRYGDDELLALLRRAYARRGTGVWPGPPPPALGLPYERALRAVGGLADRAGLRNLRLVEQPGAVLLQGTPGGVLRRGYRTHRLTAGELRAVAESGRLGVPGDLGPPLG